MKLLTQEIRRAIPKLRGQEDKGDDAVIYVKFFAPWTSWTWYATEFDGQDLFFGLVDGFEKELGYFSLSELEQIQGPIGLKVERDLYFGRKTIGEVK